MKIDGKKVVDARKPLILEIKDRDVKNSHRKDASGCAAVVACKRQLKVKDVRVHLAFTYIDDGEKWIRYRTPGSLRSEIISFDRGASFTPGEYKINPASATNKLGAAQPKRDGPRPAGKGKGIPYHRVTNVRASQFSDVWKKKATA